jgi:hypothetical protein
MRRVGEGSDAAGHGSADVRADAIDGRLHRVADTMNSELLVLSPDPRLGVTQDHPHVGEQVRASGSVDEREVQNRPNYEGAEDALDQK